MRILGIIPARYASTRFPAKALADIGGKSMIRRVYEQARKATQLDQVIVATDDERILNHVKHFGGQAVMTSENHHSGTDRCFEALSKTGDYEYVINIQGDEPFISPEPIDSLAAVLDGVTELATLVKIVDNEDILFNVNVPKAVLNKRKEVMYFSRQTIPYLRNAAQPEWLDSHVFYKHIGIYAYRSDVLAEITKLPVSGLEKAEALEQLRWLENGYAIKAVITSDDSHGVDTPDDLERVTRKFLS
ncbi:3-deoxy-manno-octulosonate cytidylyltransferase [Dyadobacter sediminis]|uniref:3-deoxy-manno-octulosonate cytidylyltransferase n=1 Tax=Dyadobacter sediminis TaxID=1493691 RepID=A0A5R9KAR5_9BACT|nr:3-deoxy-manno-octulosonate cytidylyltransferase [Dyadobacter sediminis]TLU91852.1 3-deoxy-manno-octulosonate cytidylyltransferase [Dyadobacter sediminis]GGB99713.1 3-deoxy-manno-octulosonate cytidylyltransferase [Dyadobacter sediminis]